jgi:hypothetical protein
MGINPQHLRRLIRETLDAMGERYASPVAVELLMLTTAQESGLGLHLWQVGGGPALGIYQMEPGRWEDTVVRGERLHDALAGAVGADWGDDRSMRRLVYDLRYATAMARAAYWLIPEPLPGAADLDGLDAYYQAGWCRGCKARPGDAKRAYLELAGRP